VEVGPPPPAAAQQNSADQTVTPTYSVRVATRLARWGRQSRPIRLRPCTLLLTRLSRPGRRAVYRIVGSSQIADRVISPSLQRAEHIGDVRSLHTCIVHAADADMHHIGVAAEPN